MDSTIHRFGRFLATWRHRHDPAPPAAVTPAARQPLDLCYRDYERYPETEGDLKFRVKKSWINWLGWADAPYVARRKGRRVHYRASASGNRKFTNGHAAFLPGDWEDLLVGGHAYTRQELYANEIVVEFLPQSGRVAKTEPII